MNILILVYLGSVLLSLAATSIIIYIAKSSDLMDKPDIRKIHSKPIPRIGGVAIFFSAIAVIIPALLFFDSDNNNPLPSGINGLLLLLAICLVFILGLIDDISGVRAKNKLFVQVSASLIVCAIGIRIDSITLTENLVINFGWFSWPVTVFWLTGLTNAVNLIDGLDGLAAGICAAACGVIAILTLYFGIPVMMLIMLALLGALTGFLFFNFNPAKVFMGDSGSLFLGFTIATASVLCYSKTETIIGLALPVLAMGIPVFDTLFSILRRFLERRSIFSPDSGHFHHRLLAMGLGQRQAVLIVYSLTLAAAGFGMFMLAARNTQTIIIFVCILLLLALVFRVVGTVRLRETTAGIKRKLEIAQQTKQEIESFEQIELHFRNAMIFEQWWQAVCFAAEKMDFIQSRIPLTNRDGSSRMLAWKGRTSEPEDKNIISSTFPLRDRRDGQLLNLEVQVNVKGSLESAGRRLSLFSRLLEQYGIAQLPN